jgi:hypothetical protein
VVKVIFFIFASFSLSGLSFDVNISDPIYSDMGDNIQGIAESESYWFISNQYEIYQVPRNYKLIPKNFYPTIIKNYKKIGIPKKFIDLGYHHFGGISTFRNYVVVALERIRPLKILFFKQDSLALDFVYDVPQDLESLSWVATSDENIYFSENKITANHPLYRLHFDSQSLEIINFESDLRRIQGGAYDKSDKTLLLSADMGSYRGGVYRLDPNSKDIKQEIAIRYNSGFPAYQEIEGLCLYIQGGIPVISLLMLDNNYFEDSFHFIDIRNFSF